MSSKKPTLEENQIVEQRAMIAYLSDERAKAIKAVDAQKEELQRLRIALSASCKDVIAKSNQTKDTQKQLDGAIEMAKYNAQDAMKYLGEWQEADASVARWQLIAVLLSTPYVYVALRFLIAHVSIVIR